MTLQASDPEFNSVEHLQSVMRNVINRDIIKDFADVTEDLPYIGSPRSSLRAACYHDDKDSIIISVARLLTYYFICRRGQDLHPPLYTLPVGTQQAQRRFAPQIHLYFEEPRNHTEPGYAPVEGTISFRIMGKDYDEVTRSNAETWAQRIKTLFGGSTPFVWRKGKVLCAYTDKEKGYQLQLLCRDETEGKRVIEQVLDIQQHTPDYSSHMTISTAESPTGKYPTIPQTKTIYGRSRHLPRRRPIADVTFLYGTLHLWGMPNPVVLYDRRGHYKNALVND
jgi:hypothetical protein